MKINTLKFSLLYICMVSLSSFGQNDKNWQSIGQAELGKFTNLTERNFPETSNYYELNLETFRLILLSAPEVFTKESNTVITIPNIDGQLEKFKIWEDSNFAPELQARYPSIRAYSGSGIDDPTATLKISLDPRGIQTMVLRADKQSEFIEPYTTDGTVYALFNSSDRNKGELPFNCTTKGNLNLDKELIGEADKSLMSNTQSLKKFRLALSCTGEYTLYFGGVTGALAAMNATMTRVNGVFEKDLAVKLEIIANNTDIIFTSSVTDPYSNASVGSNPNNPTWNLQLQTTLTNTIGNANYDIGHLFGKSGGGGNAGCIGCICKNPTSTSDNEAKGSAFTSPSDGIPASDTFDIDYVAHEMGHQLGANHTFSHQWEGETTTSNSVQVEPGSGSTIMGYAGVTNYNVQAHSDAYFTYRSISQIQTNLASKACASSTPLANVPPVVSAGSNYIIPKGTPFMLTGSGSDAEDGALTYTWEQNNPTTSSGFQNGNSLASLTKISGPIFRSIAPSASPTRYFPALSRILANTLSTSYESVSNVSRALTFTLTARDNAVGGGQTNTDTATVTVNSLAGPFDVTSQNTSGITYPQGSAQDVTWTVNNTATLAGSANVDILLSTDSGLTYTTVLAAATPNDGSETITIPSIVASSCRIMVKPTGNVFLDINTKSFAIGALSTADFELNNITLYPNPATDTMTISMKDQLELPDSFVIYNGLGQTIQNTKVSSTSNLTINTSALSIGVYFIKINKDKESKTLRFIKN